MRFQFSVEELQFIVQPKRVHGRFDGIISSIANLREASSGSLSFFANPKYAQDVAHSKASILLLPEDFEFSPRVNQVAFFCENPSLSLTKICQHIEKLNENSKAAEIDPSAIIHPSVRLAKNVSIGPCVVLEERVSIGENSTIGAGTFIGKHSSIGHHSKIFPNVSLMSFSQIGNYAVIHSGAVIGSDGFGFAKIAGKNEKIPQIGNVILEDFVDVGANVTIDRARFASTIVGEGTKIDNLVQIGHNVKIGKHCIIVSQVGIAGSVTIGDGVTIGGQVGIAGHLHIADNTQICAQSGVTKNTAPNSILLGSPAIPHGEAVRQFASIARLPEILQKLKRGVPSNPFLGEDL
ncbi:MAG: UDP-3-O-(3-hydroxymyristoyl)glucosamine N-acyltransferase [Puniceicoccales bacterium]|jgi:UDP-3-O-[3-hydroxymyristoyl] glucosamine N-acyltransferase|nr:UDP-3-O-(3-hydroxymyristoyl)glucosamine N-acyltransferase [Puniceicoccales bacterium]